MSISIYEFSRSFKNSIDFPTESKLICGEDVNDVNRQHKSIPSEIQQAVKHGEFDLDNNLSLKQGDFALIARDIDKYSVLSVITTENDQYNRASIVYRYFWLEKNITLSSGKQSQIDGIATLISWWHDAGEPKYNLDSNGYTAINLNKHAVKPIYSRRFDQYFSNVEGIFDSVSEIPYCYVAQKQNGQIYPHYLNLHSLVLKLEEKHNFKQQKSLPTSWAWNAGELKHPNKFAFVLSCDENAGKSNTQKLNGYRTSAAITYEFSQIVYKGYVGENIQVGVVKKGNLNSSSKVNIWRVNDLQSMKTLQFLPNQNNQTVTFTINDGNSEVQLYPYGGASGILAKTQLVSKSVYEFDQPTYRGDLNDTVQVNIIKKGNLNQKSTVKLDNGQEVHFGVNESQNTVLIPVQKQEQIIRFEGLEGENLSNTVSKTIIAPNPLPSPTPPPTPTPIPTPTPSPTLTFDKLLNLTEQLNLKRVSFYLIAGVCAALVGWGLSQALLLDLAQLFGKQILIDHPDFILLPLIATFLAGAMITTEIFVSNPTRYKSNKKVAWKYVSKALIGGLVFGLVMAFITLWLYQTSLPAALVRIFSWTLIGLFIGWAESNSWKARTQKYSVSNSMKKAIKKRLLYSKALGFAAGFFSAILIEIIRPIFTMGGYEDPIGFSLLGLCLGFLLSIVASPSYQVALRAGEGFEAIAPEFRELPPAKLNSNYSGLHFDYESGLPEIEEGLSIELSVDKNKKTRIISIGSSRYADIILPNVPEKAAQLEIKPREVTITSLHPDTVDIQREPLAKNHPETLRHNQIVTFYHDGSRDKYYRFIFYNRFLS